MRKRTFSFISDKTFWYLVDLLPLIAWVLFSALSCKQTGVMPSVTLAEFLGGFFSLSSSDFISSQLGAISSFIGSDFLLAGSSINLYLTYLIYVMLSHLFFDFVVFIPRLAHKWLGKIYNDEDN